MATIIQGEQYAVEFVLTNGDESITPSNADDVKIKMGITDRLLSVFKQYIEILEKRKNI